MAQKISRATGGFVQLIIILVLSVIILSLLGVSISSLLNNKTLKENFIYLWDGLVWLWNSYLVDVARDLWSWISAKIN